MTEITIRTSAGVITRIAHWIYGRQRAGSARVHATGDEIARDCGWEVKQNVGRLGFGTRIYRDPRFDGRRRQLPRGELRP